jgi:hypothetical protein
MTGYASKRQAAWDKFAEPWNGTGLWKEIDSAVAYQQYAPHNLANYTIAAPPKPVGYWVLYENAPVKTKFGVYAKPTYQHIRNTEIMLGWKWEDA